MGSVEETLTALGIVLPPTRAPAANYVPWTTVGDLLFTCGCILKSGVELTKPFTFTTCATRSREPRRGS
jgi:hypothetical protein